MGEQREQRREATALQRKIPNALTWSRVVMTVAFVAVLSVYRYEESYGFASYGTLLLLLAAGLFVVAALTDAADGYLARRWNAVSVFGRIVDPLADKVLVLGALIMMAGANFGIDHTVRAYAGETLVELRYRGQITGFASWMVVVILSRELLVTTMRGALEGRGIDFSAIWMGKVKMIVQSVAIPLMLLVALAIEHDLGGVVLGAESSGIEAARAALRAAEQKTTLNVGLAWVTTVVTAVSVVPYVTRAMRAMGPRSEVDG